LNTQFKESQQQNRRYEQELESLNFRNQQLTKRVTVLQDEAEQIKLNSKKKQKKGQNDSRGGVSSIEESVLENELQSKIAENASLHQKVNDLEEEHRRG
jgi:protein phosphatase 1 regulatory subunit 21